MKLVVRAGLRERKDTREKLNALIASQMRVTESQVHLKEAQTELAKSQARMQDALTRLAEGQARGDAKLEALIDIVRNEHNGGKA